jgi:hypothetical protein
MLRQRYESWKTAGARLNGDPSLIARFDFEAVSGSSWRVPNVSESAGRLLDGSIVGCQMSEGRWPGKKAVEFQRMNDRVRLEAPVALQSLTLAAWVNVRGLDREYNSLFMSDGFAPGGIHWQIHNSGRLDLHVKGVTGPHFQTCLSPAVITLDKMGQWMFLAAVVDVAHREVVHYLNGQPVSRHKLEQAPPFLLGPSDLGNWNPMGQPGGNPFLIRHFGGAMDEFLLFNRALTPAEIEALHTGGKPEPDAGTGSIQARSSVRE